MHISPSLLNGCPVPPPHPPPSPPYHLYQANKLKAVVAHPSPPLCSAQYGGGHLGPWINFLILLCSLPSLWSYRYGGDHLDPWINFLILLCSLPSPCGLTDTVATILVGGSTSSIGLKIKIRFVIMLNFAIYRKSPDFNVFRGNLRENKSVFAKTAVFFNLPPAFAPVLHRFSRKLSGKQLFS